MNNDIDTNVSNGIDNELENGNHNGNNNGIDPRNTLNDLSSKEWVAESKN